MKILVMTLTHNNADVLPFFLRHYETFADRIIAWDDASTDGTRELLNNHPLVSLRDWPHVAGINEDVFLKHWYEEYPKAVGEFDWVMIPDTDEFLYAPSMRTELETAKQAGVEVIKARGYNLVGEHFPVDDGRQIYEINPMGVKAPIYSKPVMFQPSIHIEWIRGRHGLEKCDPVVSASAVKLFHARYFGSDYTRKRNEKNYERCGDPDKGSAWSCAPMYAGLEKEGSPEWANWARTQAFNVLEAAL